MVVALKKEKGASFLQGKGKVRVRDGIGGDGDGDGGREITIQVKLFIKK